MENHAIPIFRQALKEDPELHTEARAQTTAAMYPIHEAIV
jgi:hypothetical protein